MDWRNTVILGAVVAAVLGFAYWEVVSTDPDASWHSLLEEPMPTPPSADIKRLLDFRPERIEELSVTHGDDGATSRRTAYGWTNTSKPRAIEDFLRAVAALAIIVAVDDQPSAADLGAYGLEPPAARIELAGDELPTKKIDLGHHNPSATGIYARVDDGAVVLTGAVAVWEIDKVLDALGNPTE